MTISIKLPKEQKDQIISNLKAFYAEEMSDEIGDLRAELIIDFFMKEIGPYFYNKAIDDARKMLIEKMTSLEDEFYSLEKPIQTKRN